MLSKGLLRPKKLLIILLVLLVGFGIWFAMRSWHSETKAFEAFVQQELANYGPLLLFLLLMAS